MLPCNRKLWVLKRGQCGPGVHCDSTLPLSLSASGRSIWSEGSTFRPTDTDLSLLRSSSCCCNTSEPRPWRRGSRARPPSLRATQKPPAAGPPWRGGSPNTLDTEERLKKRTWYILIYWVHIYKLWGKHNCHFHFQDEKLRLSDLPKVTEIKRWNRIWTQAALLESKHS